MGGVNGAGKSSLSGVLQSERRDLGEIINVDEIAASREISNIEAGKFALAKIKQLMNKGLNFSQETTLSGIKTSQTISRARRRGYYIRLYYVGLETVEESIARIRVRAENGGHYIPDEDVVRRFNFRYANLMRILPQCDEVHFYDNGNGFIEVARIIDGQLLFRQTVTPKWMVELSGHIQKAKDSNRM
ncbi:MAG TPA: zeta toxin family protein [Oscillospiraceae bacterium]|nr:zeta toxin family protein [Oscillospiraceae bacterium]